MIDNIKLVPKNYGKNRGVITKEEDQKKKLNPKKLICYVLDLSFFQLVDYQLIIFLCDFYINS